ncbi:MAG: hypothetical protein Q9162_002388 [Coniocarpon cinnabarinum]
MHVQIALETPHQAFTNLDFVKGRILLRLSSSTPLTSIIVKLEGESTTQLTPPPRDDYDDRPKPILEIHKVLYNTQVVFPQPGQNPNATYSILPPGNYEYPFSFKMPFNTACHSGMNNMQTLPNLIRKGNIASSNHIKAPLPPTLGGFPGLASIRYFVKCTVNRREFYKENPRVIQHINFIPIEQVRPPTQSSENFGRRNYQFNSFQLLDGGIPQPKMKRVLSNLNPTKKSSLSSASANPGEQIPPWVEVDARLPDPAILTSNEKVPLRLLVKRLDEGSLPLYLQTLQVELVGTTRIRAGHAGRNETTSWVVTSRSNINQYIEFPEAERDVQNERNNAFVGPTDDQAQNGRKTSAASIASQRKTSEASPFADEKASQSIFAEPVDLQTSTDEKPPADPDRHTQRPQITLDPTAWEMPVPQYLPPSFKTCNIERTYALEARIGIGFGAQSAKNQIILPLRLACEVWSGIKPPKSLVAAMESRPNRPPKKPVNKKPLSAEAAANVAKYHAQAQANAFVGPPGPQYAPLPPGEEEPPPSYEDALGDNLAPVDGPRNYQPPPAPAGGEGFLRDHDEKRRNS